MISDSHGQYLNPDAIKMEIYAFPGLTAANLLINLKGEPELRKRLKDPKITVVNLLFGSNDSSFRRYSDPVPHIADMYRQAIEYILELGFRRHVNILRPPPKTNVTLNLKLCHIWSAFEAQFETEHRIHLHAILWSHKYIKADGVHLTSEGLKFLTG